MAEALARRLLEGDAQDALAAAAADPGKAAELSFGVAMIMARQSGAWVQGDRTGEPAFYARLPEIRALAAVQGADVHGLARAFLHTLDVPGIYPPLPDDARAWLLEVVPGEARNAGVTLAPDVWTLWDDPGPAAVAAVVELYRTVPSKARTRYEQVFRDATPWTAQMWTATSASSRGTPSPSRCSAPSWR